VGLFYDNQTQFNRRYYIIHHQGFWLRSGKLVDLNRGSSCVN